MAVLGNINQRQAGNIFQKCIDENKLQACKPSTVKGETILRIMPEIGEDGSIRPMVNSATPNGLDFSNFYIVPVTTNFGTKERFTGIASSADRDNEANVDMVFPGLFIRLRGAQKRGELPDHLDHAFSKLTDGKLKAAVKSTNDMALTQCIVEKFNDTVLPKPKGRQCMFLTTATCESLSEKLAEAYKEGLDLFSPTHGRRIHLVPMKAGTINIFTIKIGDPMPLSESFCRDNWQPWDQAVIRHTFDDMLRKAVGCIGKELVSFAFPDDYERLYGAPVSVSTQASSVASAAADPSVEAVHEDNYNRITGKAAPEEATPELQIDVDLSTPPVDTDNAEDDDEAEAAVSAPESGGAIEVDAEEQARKYEALLGE